MKNLKRRIVSVGKMCVMGELYVNCLSKLMFIGPCVIVIVEE